MMKKTDAPNVKEPEVGAVPDRVSNLVSKGLPKILIEENRDPTELEVQKLREVIGDTFNTAAQQLAEEEQDPSQVTQLLLAATKKLSAKSRKVSLDNYLKADAEFKQAYAILETSKKRGRSKRGSIWVIGFVVLFYPLLAFVLGLLPVPDKIMGLPTLVFAWGFFGGYTAVVFRHLLRVGGESKFEFMWLWVLIRPILGAIMGAFLYLALVSAVLLFSNQIFLTDIREQLLFFIAFVGGISERYWVALIKLVLSSEEKSKPQISET